jgi:hypothetical protein
MDRSFLPRRRNNARRVDRGQKSDDTTAEELGLPDDPAVYLTCLLGYATPVITFVYPAFAALAGRFVRV